MNRRKVVGCLAAGAAIGDWAWAADIPVIDTHVHLFDTLRPQGVPWPGKNDPVLYKPAMPDRYRALAVPHGVKGAIEVEASPWFDDNQWVLDVIAKEPLFVGTVGNLEVGKPGFAANLEKLNRNPLFLGIRYGNLWNRDIHTELGKPQFVEDLKLLSKARLSLDVANPTPQLVADVVRITDLVPDLRVIVDHLPQLTKPADTAAAKTYQSHLQVLGRRPQVYVKISQVFRSVNGAVQTDRQLYRGVMDELFGVFGQNRVLYGSDWPNSDKWQPYSEVFGLVNEFFLGKGATIAEKYFWR
ncbi:MAG TPA: amidohydrolase family protein, partial [Bryobacteraceae bacterium]|nr:amidohydrolase family protein [Bryobacteraceae bacterium]